MLKSIYERIKRAFFPVSVSTFVDDSVQDFSPPSETTINPILEPIEEKKIIHRTKLLTIPSDKIKFDHRQTIK